jgi:hypothetical protein
MQECDNGGVMRIAIALFLSFGFATLAETKLGKPLTLKEATPIATVLAEPGPYVGKMVQVKGKITEVCQMQGCWMALTDTATNKMIRIKVNDGEIVFPTEAVGKTAIAEGTLTKIEMTREQALASAKHEAEERGRKFDPSKIKSGQTIYQIRGLGAVVLD